MSHPHAAHGNQARLLGIALFTLMAFGVARAAGISVIGNWSEQIGPDDLTGGAGTDLRSAIDSVAGQAIVAINDMAGNGWTVWVRRQDSTLPTGVSLAVRRSSDGNGGGIISGGSEYLVLGDQEQALFIGSGDRSGVGLQLQLSGISISQTPHFYGCSIVYRVQ